VVLEIIYLTELPAQRLLNDNSYTNLITVVNKLVSF